MAYIVLIIYVFVDDLHDGSLPILQLSYLAELREKYRFNITPLADQGAELKKSKKTSTQLLTGFCFVLLTGAPRLREHEAEAGRANRFSTFSKRFSLAMPRPMPTQQQRPLPPSDLISTSSSIRF